MKMDVLLDLRVYMKDKDIAATISIHEIREDILMSEDKFFILAGDGLFEYFNSEEVGNIV